MEVTIREAIALLHAHLCSRARMYSSRLFQGSLKMSGRRSFFHFSRHCLPARRRMGAVVCAPGQRTAPPGASQAVGQQASKHPLVTLQAWC